MHRRTKSRFGPWFFAVLQFLAKAKVVRGTILDVFSYSVERKNDLKLISQYERDMTRLLPMYNMTSRELIKEIALLPLDIKGFGHVKERSVEDFFHKRTRILTSLEANPVTQMRAAE